MNDQASQMLQVLSEMRDLLRLMAEPAIAERDKRLRESLREIVGAATGKKAKAVLLMDGTRHQAGIAAECGINQGDLSVLVKKLSAASLLSGEIKQPSLAISIPRNFFDEARESK